MIRAFVAVQIPEKVQQTLGQLSRSLREMGLVGSFPKAESIHLTLKFLGDVQESDIERLGEAIKTSVQGIERFRVRIRGLGVFPNLSSPRVVWIGFEESEALAVLQSRLEGVLANLGFPPEDRPFRPHLTLARLRSRENLRTFASFFNTEGKAVSAGEVEVDSVHLYRSELRPDGARYTRLRTAELTAAHL